jgi:uncharacterized protein YndB with AHSA1/START domain
MAGSKAGSRCRRQKEISMKIGCAGSEKICSVVSLVILAFGLAPNTAHADVGDAAPNGFTVKISTDIQATPAEVFRRLIHVGDWWSPDHTFSGDAHNLSIEERPAGCFCERLPNQGSVRHMEVISLAPGKTLRMSGALGPLQGMAAIGTLTFSLSPAEGGTKLDLTYAVAGYLPQGMNSWAAPVDAMLTEQVIRLKTYVETGSPAGKARTTTSH